MNDKSWSQVAESTSLEGFAVLDLLLMNASEPIGDIRIGDCLGCSDQDFKLLRVMIQTESKIRMLNFRKSKFQLFKGLVNKTPRESVLGDKGEEQSRAGRRLALGYKSNLSPGVGSQERNARD